MPTIPTRRPASPGDVQSPPGCRLGVQSAGPIGSVDGEPRFILDGHLGRLSRRLRMLGYDCLYRADFADEDLARNAVAEARYLLSRDRRLLMRKAISRGYLVRNLDTARQLVEVARHFELLRWMTPFTRCIRCNHVLRVAAKQDVLDKLQPLTRLYYEEFRLCPTCGQVYWSGSHVEHMRKVILDLGSEQPT